MPFPRGVVGSSGYWCNAVTSSCPRCRDAPPTFVSSRLRPATHKSNWQFPSEQHLLVASGQKVIFILYSDLLFFYHKITCFAAKNHWEVDVRSFTEYGPGLSVAGVSTIQWEVWVQIFKNFYLTLWGLWCQMTPKTCLFIDLEKFPSPTDCIFICETLYHARKLVTKF